MELTAREMAKAACKALNDKKADDIIVLDIRGVSVMADYFVIAGASNAKQLLAMQDAVEEELEKYGCRIVKPEGSRNSGWILLDYKDIIIHLFSKEDRIFYDLERIWQDGVSLLPEEL